MKKDNKTVSPEEANEMKMPESEQPSKREVSAPSPEATAEQQTTGASINRTDFMESGNLQFVDFFKSMSEAATASGLYEHCVPTDKEIATESTDLQNAKDNAKSTPSDANKTKYDLAIAKAKKTANAVADYTEKNYVTNAALLARLGFRLNKKPGKFTAPPKDPITDLRIELVPGILSQIMLKWSGYKGMGNKVLYILYQSTDGGKSFVQAKTARNWRNGIRLTTQPGVDYIFYFVPETSGGFSPESNRVSWRGQG